MCDKGKTDKTTVRACSRTACDRRDSKCCLHAMQRLSTFAPTDTQTHETNKRLGFANVGGVCRRLRWLSLPSNATQRLAIHFKKQMLLDVSRKPLCSTAQQLWLPGLKGVDIFGQASCRMKTSLVTWPTYEGGVRKYVCAHQRKIGVNLCLPCLAQPCNRRTKRTRHDARKGYTFSGCRIGSHAVALGPNIKATACPAQPS